MGKVYVTVDGKKKSFDSMEEAQAFQSGLPHEFKKQAKVEETKEETLSSNVETKSVEALVEEDPELAEELEAALEEGEVLAEEVLDLE